MFMTSKFRLAIISFLLVLAVPVASFSQEIPPPEHKIQSLVGESLQYYVSFLWFDRLAEGSIKLSPGEKPGTFLVIMEAKTIGMAAFFTNERVAQYQTLMEIGSTGLLQPLWHSKHTIRGKKGSRREKISKYTFDYAAGQVRYQKIKNGKIYKDESYTIEKNKPLLDIMSSLYNLRLGFYGAVGEETILIPTFHRKGTQDIVIEALLKMSRKDKKFFVGDTTTCRILVDPSVFGTEGRDTLASFDSDMRPHKVIIKNVIGMGDLRINPQIPVVSKAGGG